MAGSARKRSRPGSATSSSRTAILPPRRPTPCSDQLKFNRAIEVYLTQLPAVAIIESRHGMRDFGAERSNQVVIWETLMDAETLVLTANTETVYGMGFLDLKGDGPTVSRPRRRCSARRWTR